MKLIDFANKLRNKGMLVKEMAEKTGYKPNYLSALLNGHSKPTIQTAERFSKAFEVPLREVWDEDDPEPLSPRKKAILDALGDDEDLISAVQRYIEAEKSLREKIERDRKVGTKKVA